jgi:hypothetical protein
MGYYLGPRRSGPFGGLLGVILTPPDCYPSSTEFSTKLTRAPAIDEEGMNCFTFRIEFP